ncbi:MAG: hypothetical protein KDB07_12595 [Planctomycetes bacterium]|nr:hypothetical protein [Planctomycetota bacterium]
MRSVSGFSLVVLLTLFVSACGGGPTKTETPPSNKGNQPKVDNQPAKPAIRPPTSDFIRDRDMQYVTENGVTRGIDQGPLLGYQIRLNYALDPDKCSYREGKLEGTAIVFGIPDGKGDTGASFNVAFDRAAELYERKELPMAADQEVIEAGTIALVNIVSLGYPSGRKAQDKIPVAIVPLGNAKSVLGGHIYPTSLYDPVAGTLMAVSPYTQFWEEEITTREAFFARKTFRDIFDPEGTLEDEDGNAEKKPDESYDIKRQHYILKGAFSLLRDTGWQDLGRDEIVLTLGWDRPEIVEGVYQSLQTFAEASKQGFEFQVRRDPISETRFYVVPSLREGSIERFYDDVRTLFFEIRPRHQLDILVDENFGRILVVGPEARRSVLRSFDFGLKRQRIKDYQPTGEFRLVGTLSRDRSKVDLAWSKLKGSDVESKGSDTIVNDFGQILRYAYDKGMSVGDTTVFVLEAVELGLINARLVRQQEVKRVKVDETKE